MALRLVILGSGTGRPRGNRAPPGILVEGGGARVLLDPGPGACHRLAGAGGDLRTLDAVCVSHLHVDHVADVAPLLFALRNPAYARTLPLALLGGPGFAAHVEGLRRLHGESVAPAGYELRVREGDRWRMDVRDLGVQAGPVEHTDGAVGFRLMAPDGTVLAYSGDTTGDDGCVALAERADCLLIECSGPDAAPIAEHATPRAVARVAKAARVRRVVLTHFYPELGDPDRAAAEVAQATGIPTVAATDRLVIEIATPDPVPGAPR